MALKRFETWDTRELPAFFAARKHTPFLWGTNDCSLFAADGIKAITGVDIAEEFRGKYNSEASAFQLIKSVTNGSSVIDAAAYCASKHGLTEWWTPLFAQRGDLVVIDEGSQYIVGLVYTDPRAVVAVGEKGILYYPLSSVVRAWKV